MSGRTGTAPPPDCRLWKKSARAAAREEAHVRREREKSVASRNRRQRKNVQLAKR